MSKQFPAMMQQCDGACYGSASYHIIDNAKKGAEHWNVVLIGLPCIRGVALLRISRITPRAALLPQVGDLEIAATTARLRSVSLTSRPRHLWRIR